MMAPVVNEGSYDSAEDPGSARPLIGTSIYRHLFFGCILVGAALFFVSPLLAFVPQGLALLMLVTWSTLATVNVGRAKAKTAYADPPKPSQAGFSWVAIVVVGLPAFIAVGLVRRWADGLPFDK